MLRKTKHRTKLVTHALRPVKKGYRISQKAHHVQYENASRPVNNAKMNDSHKRLPTRYPEGGRNNCTKTINMQLPSNPFLTRMSAHLQETMHPRAVEEVEKRKGVDEQPSRPAEAEAWPPPTVILPPKLEVHQGHLHHVNHGNGLLLSSSQGFPPAESKPCVSYIGFSLFLQRQSTRRSLRLAADRGAQPTKNSRGRRQSRHRLPPLYTKRSQHPRAPAPCAGGVNITRLAKSGKISRPTFPTHHGEHP